jgi:hypothetical protein
MKKIYILAIATLATINISAQCNGRYQSDIFGTIDVSTVQYGSNLDLSGATVPLEMDIYQPQGDTETARPVVIVVHGGSFSAGTKNDADMVYFATELAKKGYVCASINYRLAGSAFSLIAEETTVKVVINAIQDGKAAVRYFRKDAATTNTYKIDPDQIFMGGSSAGGILAMNLTYISDITDLPSNWQPWVTDVGGLEGVSGNPGYCSLIDGTFGFAGAAVDTAFIDADDVPWYGSHAASDGTVLYGYGQPLGGFTPISLYGSSLINERMNNVSTYHHFDDYTGGSHPPYNGSGQIMADNKDSLTVFLYNILNCNPNNLKKPTQKSCGTITSIEVESNLNDFEVYPNPFNNELSISLSDKIGNTTITILNSLGEIVLEQKSNSVNTRLNLSYLPIGIYIVRVSSKDYSYSKKVIRK